MSIDIYRTQSMLAAIELLPKRSTFLRDRYFPTTAQDIFVTEDVLVEYKDEKKKKIAPCVIPRKGGIAVARDGYKTERYTPPYVAPERPLTIDDLNKKQFGETLFSQRSPQERAGAILGQDIIDLGELIDGREEYMAAQALQNNGYVLKHYADKYGTDDYEELEIHFYDDTDNNSIYTPSEAWSTTSEVILSDITAMARLLTDRGLPAAELVMEPSVADTVINNAYIQKLLDNRRLNLVDINPTVLPNGAVSLGKINVNGRVIELISYEEKYVDEDGTQKQYIEEGNVVLTAPNVGRTLYGAVTQMEEYDREFHSYPAKRVPHITSDVKSSVRTLTEKARPLIIPNYKTSWICSTVLF